MEPGRPLGSVDRLEMLLRGLCFVESPDDPHELEDFHLELQIEAEAEAEAEVDDFHMAAEVE